MSTGTKLLSFTAALTTVISTPFAFSFVKLTYDHSKSVQDPSKRGSFPARLQEAASSLYYDLRSNDSERRFGFLTAAEMSSREYANSDSAAVEAKKYEEITKLGEDSLLRVALADLKTSDERLVFKATSSEVDPAFTFSGKSTSVFDPKAREDIYKRDYQRCELNLSFNNDQSSLQVKTIVVGDGSNLSQCEKLSAFFARALEVESLVVAPTLEKTFSDTNVVF